MNIHPLVVKADAVAELVIAAGVGESLPAVNASIEVNVYPMEGLTGGRPMQAPVLTADGRTLRLRHHFPGEQEHIVRLDRVAGDVRTPLLEFRVYSLREDLFALRPFKGDFHLHSDRSDGQDHPAFVAGAARRIGLDFMAVTDHARYEPSLEAIRAYQDVDIDLRLYPGEEVHPPDNPVHIINFGGRVSVNDLMQEAGFAEEVRKVERTISSRLAGPMRRQYAACVWCYRKIREAGGLGMFCHPYWITRNAYNVPEPIIEAHFEDIPFDALEAVGGFGRNATESNVLQVSRYHDETAKGKRIPIVAASDAHGCTTGQLFGWYYTIVLAPSPGLRDIADAVRSRHAVAVEAIHGETIRTYGPFRLVKYVNFLLREFFPRHDALCEPQGQAMLDTIAGDPAATERLHACFGQTQGLYETLWGEEKGAPV